MEDWLKIKRKAISANAKGWTIPGMFEYIRTLEKELSLPRGNVSFSRMISLIDRLTNRPLQETKEEFVDLVTGGSPNAAGKLETTGDLLIQDQQHIPPPGNDIPTKSGPIQKGGRKRKEVKPQGAPKDAASDGEKLSEPAEKPE